MVNGIARHDKPSRAIRLQRVCNMTALSPATVWRKEKNDPAFPRSFKLSEKVRCWDENEVVAWIEAKKAERGAI
jgi:predicted DNA-binding transcriptional regulator AlpA